MKSYLNVYTWYILPSSFFIIEICFYICSSSFCIYWTNIQNYTTFLFKFTKCITSSNGRFGPIKLVYPSHFVIEVPVLSQESKRSCICERCRFCHFVIEVPVLSQESKRSCICERCRFCLILIEIPISSQESKRSSICELEVLILHLPTIVPLDLGTVLTLWFFSIVFICCRCKWSFIR